MEAATIPAAVEMLMVPAPSPPVPTTSTSGKATSGKGRAAARKALAAPATSSAVSPRECRAARRAAVSASDRSPAPRAAKTVEASVWVSRWPWMTERRSTWASSAFGMFWFSDIVFPF